MASLIAKIATKIVKKYMNFNPEENPNLLDKMKYRNLMIGFRVPKGYELRKFEIDGIPTEILKKIDSSNKKAIYLLHGGGYIMGLNNIYRNTAYKYSMAAGGADVILIEYRLAPEHTFPAALEDALKGWEWMIENGYKEEDIIVIGDSAGGNLTLSLTLKLKELKKKLPKALVLISPWTDMTASGKSYFENYNKDAMFGSRYEIKEDMVDKMLNSPIYSYCGDHDRKDPLLSPIFGDYKDFPPTFITVGSHEMLLDDSKVVAEKIEKAGGDVFLHIDEGMFHVYPMADKLMPESKRAMQKILEFIKKHSQ